MNNRFILLCIAAAFTLFPAAAPGATTLQSGGIEWLTLFMGLFGGLALFLAGLEQLSDGLKKAAASTLKVMLARLTTNRVMGALTGAVITGILNSSSITTVLVVGFVTAGIMSLPQSVGVIMGANIGSTVTAQILAFNISHYALLPVALGFFLIFINKGERLRHTGMMLMGMGLVFFGMAVMSEAMSPLRTYQPFLDLLGRMANPLLGLLAGAVFTGLVQSSAATVGIAIALASEGFLTLEAGVALALGANIGTCVTALLAALGKPPEAVRAAVVHISFNIAGVAVWFFFIPYLAQAATWLSPASPDLQGSARLAAEVPRQIANANTLFNVINTCLFLPFTSSFAWIARRVIPDRPPTPGIIQPDFLDDSVLQLPSLALERVRLELARMSTIILSMYRSIETAMRGNEPCSFRILIQEDDKVDLLEAACFEYLSKIRQQQLSAGESEEHQRLMVSAVALETLADVIETDLVELGEEACQLEYRRSDETRKIIADLYLSVETCLTLLMSVLSERNPEAAKKIMQRGAVIRTQQRELMLRKSSRLGYENQAALRIARLEISFSDKLVRMYSLIKRITLENVPKLGQRSK